MSRQDPTRNPLDSSIIQRSGAESGVLLKVNRSIRRVLVIDDTPAIQRLVKRILELADIEVLIASDGEEGVAMHAMLGDNIDAVVLDYEMPKMNGLDALKQIMRQRPETRVVFFSGAGGGEWIQLARSAGASSILRKPFLPSDLIKALQDSVESERMASTG